MRFSRSATAIIAGLALAGTATLPAWAFQSANDEVQAINAELVPTNQEVQAELSRLNERLEAGRKASFYSATASSEYLAAKRYYEFGRYDEAIAHAQAGESALPSIPNWPDTASR